VTAEQIAAAVTEVIATHKVCDINLKAAKLIACNALLLHRGHLLIGLMCHARHSLKLGRSLHSSIPIPCWYFDQGHEGQYVHHLC
jgi:hypothetical protein